jgi:hypothetical protein
LIDNFLIAIKKNKNTGRKQTDSKSKGAES